jgi:glycosyltransferase involved in cell wall biosynthesis/ubiquinone/menaquinone biosynthesis C-methylase UbiE/septal ring factor EnvC (AmiA/AmiB activator)
LSELKFTGERYVSDLNSAQISYEHWHRYLYATQFVKGRNVLDIASGEGYGSNLLAQTAKSVIGIDVSDEAVVFASEHYRRDNLKFIRGSVENIPISGAKKIDVVISFETLEHVSADAQNSFLKEIKRLLRDDGIFLVSSPNKLLYSDIPKYQNEFHMKEFYEREFFEFLHQYFRHIILFGQKISTGSNMWCIDKGNPDGIFTQYYLNNDGTKFVISDDKVEPIYFIAVCSDSKIKPVAHSFLVDNSLGIISERNAQISSLHQTLSDRDNQIAAYRQSLSERDVQAANLTKQVSEAHSTVTTRDAEISRISSVLSDHENRFRELNQTIGDRDNRISTHNQTVSERDVQIATLSRSLTEHTARISELHLALSERESRIASLNQSLTEKAARISELEKTVSERESQIASLNQSLTEQAARISELEKILSERELRIASLNQSFTEKAALVSELEKTVSEHESRIASLVIERTNILHCTSWKITEPLRLVGYLLRRDWNSAKASFRALRSSSKSSLTNGKDIYKNSERNVQIATLNKSLTEQASQIPGFRQTLSECNTPIASLNQSLTEHTARISELEKTVSERESRITSLVIERTNILHSTSWKVTEPLRLVGYLLRRDWYSAKASFRTLRNSSKSSLTNGKDIFTNNEASRPEKNAAIPSSHPKRILLVSFLCPTRAHAGGLRILDIYSLIRSRFPTIRIDLYTYKRPNVDWSYEDVEKIFDNIYCSPIDDLLPSHFMQIPHTLPHYDVIDLQFHQAPANMAFWKELGEKIIFTPMESFVRGGFISLGNGDLSQGQNMQRLLSQTKIELSLCDSADEVVCVSNGDSSALAPFFPDGKICALETGISHIEFADAFSNRHEELAPQSKERIVLYIAYFGSDTNVTALKWYLETVHPLIMKEVPDYSLRVVGRGDTSYFRSQGCDSVEFIGEVPQLSPYIRKAKVGIAPALNGGGFRGKINQYAIYGVPAVASSVAANDLSYCDGRDIFVADQSSLFSQYVLRLLLDDDLNRTMGQRARENAFTHYTWESRIDSIKRIYRLEDV